MKSNSTWVPTVSPPAGVAAEEQARGLGVEVGEVAAVAAAVADGNRARQIEVAGAALAHLAFAESAIERIELDVAAPGKRGIGEGAGARLGRVGLGGGGLLLGFQRLQAPLQILDL
jgi:hypothetical protein